jgi:OmpA-OmpF porin, OOP family
MKKSLFVMLCALFLTLAMGFAVVQKDDPKCQDHPLLTRMPDYWIRGCVQKQFDAYQFRVTKDKKEPVEGRYWWLSYYPQADLVSKPSELQIQRNYEAAIRKLGGEVIWSEKGRSTLKLAADGRETWIEVTAEFTGKYWLTIVQKEGMAQDVVGDAAALGNDLNTTGHAAVYGIYFDTGKSTIKPESASAIGEIAKLLTSTPALKLYVVGHTDNVGGVESNVKLSQDRAEAVLQSLVRDHGIAASRLRAWGCGLFSPVATNDSEEGRAKNRRVELVKQ